MSAISDRIEAATGELETASGLAHDIVNGPASGAGSTVTTEGGPVKTFAKMLADAEADHGNAAANAELALTRANAAAASATAAAGSATAADNTFDELVALGTLTNADKAIPNGVASLDSGGKVPTDQIPTTGLAITLRQGTEAERVGTPLDSGEPVYTTDRRGVYIGDGSTAGGRFLGVTHDPANSETTAQYAERTICLRYYKTPINQGGAGSVGTNNTPSAALPFVEVGGQGGINHGSAATNGGNAGNMSSFGAIIQIRSGDGGPAGAGGNGGNGGLIANANLVFVSGTGGFGAASGTGAGGVGGRAALIRSLGGIGGAGGANGTGGAGGITATFASNTSTYPSSSVQINASAQTQYSLYNSSGNGGNADAGNGGAGGRCGCITMQGGHGGNASGATVGGVGGNAGYIMMIGANANGTVAGKNAGYINLNGGENYDGSALNFSDGAINIITRGATCQLGVRVAVPANSAAAGRVGEWASDDTYFYYYGATGWRRIAGATF